MGLRATVIKKYEVEYGEANGFNYDPGTLANIIGAFCSDMYLGGDGSWDEGYSIDAFWEISRDEFVEMVDELAEMTTEEFDKQMTEEWYEGDEEKPYSKKYVLDVFTGWLAETPVDSNYVRIGWL